MNLSKSVIFPLKNGNLSNISGIPIKTTVTYLGVIICKDEKMRNDLNCDPIIRKLTIYLICGYFIFAGGGPFVQGGRNFQVSLCLLIT